MCQALVEAWGLSVNRNDRVPAFKETPYHPLWRKKRDNFICLVWFLSDVGWAGNRHSRRQRRAYTSLRPWMTWSVVLTCPRSRCNHSPVRRGTGPDWGLSLSQEQREAILHRRLMSRLPVLDVPQHLTTYPVVYPGEASLSWQISHRAGFCFALFCSSKYCWARPAFWLPFHPHNSLCLGESYTSPPSNFQTN